MGSSRRPEPGLLFPVARPSSASASVSLLRGAFVHGVGIYQSILYRSCRRSVWSGLLLPCRRRVVLLAVGIGGRSLHVVFCLLLDSNFYPGGRTVSDASMMLPRG